jgi:hypothetical protein
METIHFSPQVQYSESLLGEYSLPADVIELQSQSAITTPRDILPLARQLSQLMYSESSDTRVRTLSSRFAQGELSFATLKQLSTLLDKVPSGNLPALSSVLDQMVAQRPDLAGTVRLLLAGLKSLPDVRQNPIGKEATTQENTVRVGINPRGDYRSLVIPAGFNPVSEQQVERSIQNVIRTPGFTANSLLSMNIENLALQAANLGIKTFSDTASAVAKSQSIVTDARKTLMDKQVADFAKDLEKAIKQQDNAKKGGVFGAILKWVMPVIAVVTMVFMPMSLPLMVGMIGATVAGTASAALNTTKLVMGPNAPAWLQKLNNIMDWVSMSASLIVGGSAMWLGEKVANGVIRGLELLTQVAQGVNNGVTGFLNTKLRKEMNELELQMGWREGLIEVFTKATKANSRRLENATESWSTGNQKMIDVMTENATIRARIAKNTV